MQFVNKASVNEIEILGNKVNECIVNEQTIGIHVHSSNVDIHNLVTPENISISEETVAIEAGWLTLNLKDVNESLRYLEEENSFHIQDGQVEVFVDFTN